MWARPLSRFPAGPIFEETASKAFSLLHCGQLIDLVSQVTGIGFRSVGNGEIVDLDVDDLVHYAD